MEQLGFEMISVNSTDNPHYWGPIYKKSVNNKLYYSPSIYIVEIYFPLNNTDISIFNAHSGDISHCLKYEKILTEKEIIQTYSSIIERYDEKESVFVRNFWRQKQISELI